MTKQKAMSKIRGQMTNWKIFATCDEQRTIFLNF